MNIQRALAAALLLTAAAFAQNPRASNDPFPQPIAATEGVITVSFTEFATIPDIPRMMMMIDEPGTHRLFVNDMKGSLYSVSYDGKTVTQYLDVNSAEWGIGVQSQGSER